MRPLLVALVALLCALGLILGLAPATGLAARERSEPARRAQTSTPQPKPARAGRKQQQLADQQDQKQQQRKREVEEEEEEDDDDDEDEDDDDHDDHDDEVHDNHEQDHHHDNGVADAHHDQHQDSRQDQQASRQSNGKAPKQDKRLTDWLKAQKQAKQDVIELVGADMLQLLVDQVKHVVVLFYDPATCQRGAPGAPKCKKILQELENIDDEADEHGIQFVKSEDLAYAASIGISTTPALVYFEQGSLTPSIYVGELDEEEAVLEWLVEQKNDDTIENINRDILNHLLAQATGDKKSSNQNVKHSPDYLAVLFYKHKHPESDKAIGQLESIDDDLHEFNIHLVKLADDLMAKKYQVRQQPGLVLFRHGEPLKYPQDLTNTDDLLRWLTKPENLETKNSIESVNEKMFERFLRDTRHLAVLFHSQSSACKQCPRVMEELETIDDDLDELGVRFIKVDSAGLAKRYGVHALPSLVYIGSPAGSGSSSSGSKTAPGPSTTTIFAGDLKRADEILQWLVEQKSPHLHEIKELSGKQCRELIKSNDHVAVYVYPPEQQAPVKAPAKLVKPAKQSNQKAATKSSGRKAKPVASEQDDDDDDDEQGGDNGNNQRRRKGADQDDDDDDDDDGDDDDNDDENNDDNDDDDDDQHDDDDDILAGLENIDSECRRQSIEFVKTKDKSFIKEFGLDENRDDLPALLYFEHGQASIYDGDLRVEEDLLDWLLEQKRDDTIEEVNRKLLEKLIESSHYLVVLFYKNNCKTCQTVLETLERIDDDCDAYGINMVKINDLILAKRYGIKTYPAIVYFRNGNPLLYGGDLKNDHQVLEWLLDDDQRELHDEIEDINGKMLDKLIDTSPFLAALFYDDDCTSECAKVLHELEKIDDDTDTYGIDFVKINDFKAARKYNVHTFPTLVYFRKQTPSYYDGDLLDEERVLNWLISNDVFELDDEIEEVNKKMLDKLLETSDYIAVYFYEKQCKHCEEVLKELEHIDDEADSLDIMFVKIRDMTYAKKFGITQAPSLVYFRKKFPSIYRGDLMKEEKVLEWLRKNRYRNPELNLFMYALFTITISFILYTVFLLFCVKKNKQD